MSGSGISGGGGGVYGGLTSAQAARLIFPGPIRSGTRIGLPTAGSFALTTAIAADVMYAWPIPIPVATTLSGVAVQVGTAVAATSGKLGLALAGSDGWPLTLVAEAPSAVNMNSTAGTELVGSFTAPILVPAGIVWGLCVFNGVAQPVTVGFANTAAITLGHMIGATSIGNYTSQGTGSVTRLSRAHTYATAFPAALTGWSSTVATNPSSPVMVGVAA